MKSLEELEEKIESKEISCPHCSATGDYDLSAQEDYDEAEEKVFSVWCHVCDRAFDT